MYYRVFVRMYIRVLERACVLPSSVKYSRVMVCTQFEGLNAHLATRGAH